MIKENKSSELHGSESSCMSKTLLVFLWLMQRVYGHMVSGQQHHLDFYYTSSDVQHCCPSDFTVCYRGLTHKIEKVITALKTGDCYMYKRKKDREKREREGNRKGSNFFLGIFSQQLCIYNPSVPIKLYIITGRVFKVCLSCHECFTLLGVLDTWKALEAQITWYYY